MHTDALAHIVIVRKGIRRLPLRFLSEGSVGGKLSSEVTTGER
jgi:hypothetical protein